MGDRSNLLVNKMVIKWIWVQHPLCFHLATASDLANCLGNTHFYLANGDSQWVSRTVCKAVRVKGGSHGIGLQMVPAQMQAC